MSSSLHSACIYDSRAALLQNALPFIESGLAAGEPVLMVTGESAHATLISALPSEVPGLIFDDARSWYDAPGRALTRYISFWRTLEEQGARSLRIIGEPTPSPLPADRLERWEYFENAVNQVAKDYPFTMMCTYNAGLEHVTSRCAEVSHPYLATNGTVVENDAYIAPSLYAKSRTSRALHVPDEGVAVMRFSAESTSDARNFLQVATSDLGLDDVQSFDFIVAAGEAIANAVEHGGGTGSIRLFRTDHEIVCDIQSDGAAQIDPLHGYEPPSPIGERGRGIWMMRQLCDWLELKPRAGGTTVRLHKSLAT